MSTKVENEGVSFDDLIQEVMRNPDARRASIENSLRRHIGLSFNAARKRKRLSVKRLAHKMDTSLSQVRILLHKELGGDLLLSTLIRAMNILDMEVQFLSVDSFIPAKKRKNKERGERDDSILRIWLR